jgi:sigma-B regulation protein RsbU (phosphoserine phosphatase)
VRDTGLLDTPAEEPFDRLARLAAVTLDAPLAFVTVVDESRSFWKSCIGVDATDPADRQNLVEESFCQYVVGSDAELVVGDVVSDPRTRDNPSIAGMGVAAWAGFPLRAPGGETLGSFCVVDTRIRVWTDRDVRVLETLAEAASGEVALRAALEQSAALARTLQQTLLPPVAPRAPGLEIGTIYRAAGSGVEVLGDFYDVSKVPTAAGTPPSATSAGRASTRRG